MTSVAAPKATSEDRDFGRQIQQTNYEQYEGAQWHVYDDDADGDKLLLKICIATFGVPSDEKVLQRLNIPLIENEPFNQLENGDYDPEVTTDIGDCEIEDTTELDCEIERLIFDDSDYGSEDDDDEESPEENDTDDQTDVKDDQNQPEVSEHKEHSNESNDAEDRPDETDSEDSVLESQTMLQVPAAPDDPESSDEEDDDPSELLALYSDEQRKEAQKIRDKIIEVHRVSQRRHLKMFIIFVVCSRENVEYTMPVFRVATNDDDYSCKYVDISCRIYSSWTDWKENNTMPAGVWYCYPKFGYYTDSERGEYSFSKDTSPLLVTEQTPASKPLAELGRKLDGVAGVTGFVSSGIAIASMFTPLGPVVLGSSLVAGISSAVYGAGRSANRLIDKGTHGESLKDLESVVCWGSIALTPLSLTAGAMGSRLVQGATQEGRIMSNTFRSVFNVVNAASLTLQGGMIGLGFANLVDKYEKKQLTKLDVLQFSMSVFLFSNTLIQPKTAAGIISKAQDQHFENHRNQLSSKEAKAGFDKLLSQNKADGDIVAKSKIVRTINKVKNPEQFYQGASKFDNVKIGGRKGRTVVVGQDGGKTTRVNPSRKYGAGFEDAVKTMANELGAEGPTQFQAVAEILATELKGLSGDASSKRLHQLQTTDKNAFVSAFHRDLTEVSAANRTSESQFRCDWQALYHYRKHGHEFGGTPSVDAYFNTVPKQLFKDARLTEIQMVDGGMQKIYSMADGKFGVVFEDLSGNSFLSTIHTKKNYALVFANSLKEMTTIDCSRFTFTAICQRLAVFFGHTTLTVTAHLPDGTTGSIDNLRDRDIDPDHHEYVIRALCALGRSYH